MASGQPLKIVQRLMPHPVEWNLADSKAKHFWFYRSDAYGKKGFAYKVPIIINNAESVVIHRVVSDSLGIPEILAKKTFSV